MKTDLVDLKKLKIILIHGNGGSTHQSHWFPYVQEAFQSLGITVTSRTFPDNDFAREKYWIPFLKDELKADENSILIGHSSGAIAAMRFAEKYPIYGSVLVAGYYTDLGFEKEKISGYFDRPWQWNQIKKNQKWMIQFASTDDLFIPIEEARMVHCQLDTEYYEFTDQGHFGGDSTKLEFPELVQSVIKKFA